MWICHFYFFYFLLFYYYFLNIHLLFLFWYFISKLESHLFIDMQDLYEGLACDVEDLI